MNTILRKNDILDSIGTLVRNATTGLEYIMWAVHIRRATSRLYRVARTLLGPQRAEKIGALVEPNVALNVLSFFYCPLQETST